jgi:hypothetical protein
MKPFDNLVERLRQELMGLAMKKGNFSDEELVQKSQELDEFLNYFYASEHSRRQDDCTTRNHKAIKKKAAAPRKRLKK